jgi:hypothetical protein
METISGRGGEMEPQDALKNQEPQQYTMKSLSFCSAPAFVHV